MKLIEVFKLKIVKETILFNYNNADKLICNRVEEIKKSIEQVANPVHNSNSKFLLFNGEYRKLRKHQNGVKPIKNTCIDNLVKHNWNKEYSLDLGNTIHRPGPIDAVSPSSSNLPNNGFIGFEWETGNISSSHRSLNRLTLGILNKKILGGVLALPSSQMSKYLTDRVGNFEELEPYFPIWKNANYNIDIGYLSVIEFQHDASSDKIDLRIGKGSEGFSKR